jgi:hypothetical protein
MHTTQPLSRRARRALVVSAVTAAIVLGAAAPASAQPATRAICFPVVEEVRFVDSFGAPRAGHRHQGTDLLGQKLFHLVSPVNGVIVDLRGPGEGHSDHSLRIMDDEGWFYAFLHMNDDTWGTDDGAAPFDQVFAPGLTEGVRVQAGQFLGFMGDSGNAEGSTPHLHFEIRQPAGNLWSAVAINPYPSLIVAPRCADPTVIPPPPPGPTGRPVYRGSPLPW